MFICRRKNSMLLTLTLRSLYESNFDKFREPVAGRFNGMLQERIQGR